jgi:hypothetical protein
MPAIAFDSTRPRFADANHHHRDVKAAANPGVDGTVGATPRAAAWSTASS